MTNSYEIIDHEIGDVAQAQREHPLISPICGIRYADKSGLADIGSKRV